MEKEFKSLSSLSRKACFEAGWKEARLKVEKIGDELAKTYIIDKKNYFWKELKQKLKE